MAITRIISICFLFVSTQKSPPMFECFSVFMFVSSQKSPPIFVCSSVFMFVSSQSHRQFLRGIFDIVNSCIYSSLRPHKYGVSYVLKQNQKRNKKQEEG